jgi:predicted 2-oxoglutarate/Fe(II)-dependent dioxygenase YbiX/peroxiredoxin
MEPAVRTSTSPPDPQRRRFVAVGDQAPLFIQAATNNPRFELSLAAGRYIVLCFFGSSTDPGAAALLSVLTSHRRLFDDSNIAFFGVSIDPADEARVTQDLPGVRHFWDFDLSVSRLYGSVPEEAAARPVAFRRQWIVLDPTLRVIGRSGPEGEGAEALAAFLRGLPPAARFSGVELQAPILYLHSVFEPELCRRLIDFHASRPSESSGVMREQDGVTVGVDHEQFKRRLDCTIEDPELIAVIQNRILRRIAPEILKVHQFHATRMERYLVGCYDSEGGGHFRPHRDNTTRGTAHRRFAVTVNLNDDFEGGELSFPEYGPRSFKPPVGAAVVFSCSLLHAVSPMVRGRRYAFLPFLYDEAAARVREANRAGAPGSTVADQG